LRTFAIVVSRVYLPPGWAKFWWFADCIQYDNQRKLQKRAPPILSGKIHAPADSFISKNEGMNQGALPSALILSCPTGSPLARWCSRRIQIQPAYRSFRDGHCLNDGGEFLSLPREYFELPLSIIILKSDEFTSVL
jgi:hypothetical protein